MPRLPLFLWLILLPFVLGAQDLRLTYSEGEVQVLKDNQWVSVELGQFLKSPDLLRLEKDSVVVLEDETSRLYITAPGTWAVQELINQQKKTRQVSYMGGLTAQKLFGTRSRSQDATLGLRGEVMATDPSSGDLADLLMDQGLHKLSQGQTEEALSLLLEAYELSLPEKEAETLFYLAYAYDLSGSKLEALSYALEVKPADLALELKEGYYFLLTRLHLDLGAFQEAENLVGDFAPLIKDPENLQALFLVEGLSLLGLKDAKGTEAVLKKLLALGPDTETAHLALSLLN